MRKLQFFNKKHPNQPPAPLAAAATPWSRESEAEAIIFAHLWCRAIDRLGVTHLAKEGARLAAILKDNYPQASLNKVNLEEAKQSALPRRLKEISRNLASRLLERPHTDLDDRLGWLSDLLSLDEVERDCLEFIVRCDLSPGWQEFAEHLPSCRRGYFRARTIAIVTGHREYEITRRLTPLSRLASAQLVHLDRDGEIASGDFLMRVLHSGFTSRTELHDLLLAPAKPSSLQWEDFAHLGEMADLAVRLFEEGQPCSILIYGPVGTGKTEFAKLLATRSGRRAIFAGLSDEQGDEPSRIERLGHFKMLNSIAKSDEYVVVVDEADDVLTGNGFSNRTNWSKQWLNDIVGNISCPTIWIMNDLFAIPQSVIRRMGLAIRFETPSRATRERVIDRHADAKKVDVSSVRSELSELPAPPAIIGTAIEAAKRIDASGAEIRRIAGGLVEAVSGKRMRPARKDQLFDPALSSADRDLEDLAYRIGASDERGWSILLSGPSGTGKSAYARHLAKRLGIDVVEKRGSDLLGAYVGETEARMAEAFAEARREGALLLIDEADDFLFDRHSAQYSWQRSMVAEMLRQMEDLAAPFAATTNLAAMLDPATQRRFTMHVKFEPMSEAQAADLFQRRFNAALPKGTTLNRQTPGDFAQVARRSILLNEMDPVVIVQWLKDEAAERGEAGRMRF